MPLEYGLAPAQALGSPRDSAARVLRESTPFVFEDPTGRRWRLLKRVALAASVLTLALGVVLFEALLLFAPGRTSPLIAPRVLEQQILTWPSRLGISNPIPARLPGAEPGAGGSLGHAGVRSPGATSASGPPSATVPGADAHPSPGVVHPSASPKATPSPPAPLPAKHLRTPRPQHSPIARF